MTQEQTEDTPLTGSEEAPTLGSRIDPNYTIADLMGEIAAAVKMLAGDRLAPRISTGEAIKIAEISLQHTREMHQIELAFNTVHYPPIEPTSPHEDEVEDELDRLVAAAQRQPLTVLAGDEDDASAEHEPVVV